MSWSGRKVLVTGAGGFIGSHLAERLSELGARVRAFVHYRGGQGRDGWLENSPQRASMEVIAGDLTDRDCVAAAVEDVETVFHLGALIAIPYSYQAPYSYVRTNLEGSMNVFQAVRQRQTPRLVIASTSEVYGTAQQVPMTESHPLRGQSPYSASKIAADKMAEAFWSSFNLPVVVLRPFNTFGPRQSLRAVIPTIIYQGLQGQKTIRLGNIHATRDFNFVANTVDAFLAAGATKGIEGRTIHFGSGRETRIEELVQIIARLLNVTLEIEVEETRLRPAASEVDRLWADNALARELLGLQPAVSLESGLEKTIAWARENLALHRDASYAL
jgi:dTDP-glucose 4,6-dehydratase